MPDYIYLVIIGLLVIGLAWERDARDDALKEVTRLELAETIYNGTIAVLEQQAKVNDTELAELRERQGANHEQRETIRATTTKAKRGDQSFDSFMATPLPGLLRPGGGLLGQGYAGSPASP